MDTNDIITSLCAQVEYIKCVQHQDPSLVVLGRQVLEQLEAQTSMFLLRSVNTGRPMYIFGLPIVVDEVDINRIAVCVCYDIPIIKEGK